MSTKIMDDTKMIDEAKMMDVETRSRKKEKKKEKAKAKTNDNLNMDKKKLIIPNTLTIYINTRIANHNKLIYDPSMTVPVSKSHSVYFESLVKYNKRAINDIPPIALPNLNYTQFFEANQFDSLITRCINSFFNFQKEIDFDQAFKEGIIENNIGLTVNSLFKTNGLFYINKRPYTILGVNWDRSWSIDTKPNNKLMSPYTNLSYKDAIKQAEDEYELFKKMYPGATGDAQIKNEEIANQIKNGIQFEEKKDMSLNLKLANEMKYSAALFDDEDEFIEPNFPVLFINEPDLNTDPITFSVLLDKEEFVDFIEKNKNDLSNSLINKF